MMRYALQDPISACCIVAELIHTLIYMRFSWSFAKGGVFTVVAFTGPVDDEVHGPLFSGMSSSVTGRTTGPTYAIHVNPFIYYAATDRSSHYTRQARPCPQQAWPACPEITTRRLHRA
jgi:hypothetical protein